MAENWARVVKKNDRWRVLCRRCGLLPKVYAHWHTAASAAWRHKH